MVQKKIFHIVSGSRIRYASLGREPESSIPLQHYSRDTGISALFREILRRRWENIIKLL